MMSFFHMGNKIQEIVIFYSRFQSPKKNYPSFFLIYLPLSYIAIELPLSDS